MDNSKGEIGDQVWREEKREEEEEKFLIFHEYTEGKGGKEKREKKSRLITREPFGSKEEREREREKKKVPFSLFCGGLFFVLPSFFSNCLNFYYGLTKLDPSPRPDIKPRRI